MAELLTPTDFDERLRAGELAMTVIGMSNLGKSYWSVRLAEENGFRHLNCDDMIEAELEGVLLELGYSGGIEDVSRWMGQPYDLQFAENQQIYLDLETKKVQDIADQLEQGSLAGNTIVDTTGSVVHTSSELCRRLVSLTTVVYLEATPAMCNDMFESYKAKPKPVVWGDIYQPLRAEPPMEALGRCYKELLAFRTGLYRDMADITIPRETATALSKMPGRLATDGLLRRVRDSLPAAA